jgi:hypothetical protein
VKAYNDAIVTNFNSAAYLRSLDNGILAYMHEVGYPYGIESECTKSVSRASYANRFNWRYAGGNRFRRSIGDEGRASLRD